MINNNKMKWPLLLLCLGVWVGVFYVLFGNKNKTTEIFIPKRTQITIPEKENFDLQLSYADPFLNKGVERKKRKLASLKPSMNYNPSISRNILESRLQKPKNTKKKNIIFPKIDYKGYVKKSSGSGLASVNFDGKSIHWEKGEKIDDVYLMDIYTDSIRIQKDGVRKTIKR